MIALFIAASLELPPAEHPESIGWTVVTIAALLAILHQILDFYKKHIKEQPEPSRTYVTLAEFRQHKEERKGDVTTIQTKLDDLRTVITDSNKYHAKARSEMHRRQNNLENALYYMAGKMESEGDSHAARVIRERLEKSIQSTTHED